MTSLVPFTISLSIRWQLHICVTKRFLQNLSVDYINHKWGDKLRVSDAQRVGRWFGEVHMKLLWAVRARAGIGKGMSRPLSPTLQGERGLTLAVNVWVDAVVFSRSGAHSEVFSGGSDLPPGWEAIAGTGGFIRNLATQQIRQSIAAEKKISCLLLESYFIPAKAINSYRMLRYVVKTQKRC